MLSDVVATICRDFLAMVGVDNAAGIGIPDSSYMVDVEPFTLQVVVESQRRNEERLQRENVIAST